MTLKSCAFHVCEGVCDECLSRVSFSCVCVLCVYCAHKCAQPTTTHSLYSVQTNTRNRDTVTHSAHRLAGKHTNPTTHKYKLRHTHKFEICKYLNRCGLSYALMGPLRPTHRLWLPHGIQPTQRKRNGSSRTTCRRTLNLGCPVPASSRCGVCVYVCV